jgi:hypothetical protein
MPVMFVPSGVSASHHKAWAHRSAKLAVIGIHANRNAVRLMRRIRYLPTPTIHRLNENGYQAHIPSVAYNLVLRRPTLSFPEFIFQ